MCFVVRETRYKTPLGRLVGRFCSSISLQHRARFAADGEGVFLLGWAIFLLEVGSTKLEASKVPPLHWPITRSRAWCAQVLEMTPVSQVV